jgi:hypothetical protein
MAKIRECLGQVEPGAGATFRNLTILPLMGTEGKDLPGYQLASEAIRRGLLEVMEVDEMGHVPELLVRNKSDGMVLLLDGEELVGAKQNRIVNTTILLAAKTSTKIPVSCVERGRWRHSSRLFSPGRHSPAALRAAKARSVSRSLAAVGAPLADQGQVWAEVDRYSEASGVHSPTDAMHEIYEKRDGDIRDYMSRFQYKQGACGCIVAIGGEFVAMDLFDRPGTLEKVWQRLLDGYILDAIVMRQRAEKAYGKEDAEKLLLGLADSDAAAYPAVGLGSDWRFGASDMAGSALVYEGKSVHLCAFPGDGKAVVACDQSGHIAPPSARRRRRGPDVVY